MRRETPELEGWKVSKRVLGIVGVQLGCMIVVAWVVSSKFSADAARSWAGLICQLYIVYSLGT